MEILRGDIFYIRSYDNEQGSEQSSGRPAIVVSNNKCNAHSNVIEVVYLTTREKKPLPTHVSVVCQRMSTALCEQIHSVSIDRLSDFIRTATDEEMKQIDKALKISLGLDGEEPPVEYEQEKEAMLAHIEYLEKQVEDAKPDKDKIKELQLFIEDLKKKVSDLKYENRFLTGENGRLKDEAEAAAKIDIAAFPAELKFAQLETERNTYKAMYEQLLNKILEK